MTIDINAIREALPHRYPMLLVDRVLEVSEDEITAIKNVTINEPFFNGHFPQYPVMPGVLIMEALAQTAGVLELSKPENKGKLVFYAGMDKVKFKKQVVPGDQLVMTAKFDFCYWKLMFCENPSGDSRKGFFFRHWSIT